MDIINDRFPHNALIGKIRTNKKKVTEVICVDNVWRSTLFDDKLHDKNFMLKGMYKSQHL